MNTLTQHLVDTNVLHSEHIIEAFRAVDRADFVPEASRAHAHSDYPIHIGHQQTISQPTTVAFMLELLAPKAGDHILDIGAGSGWTTALLGHIVGTHGFVLGLERVDELVEYGTHNVEKYNMPQVAIERASAELGKPSRAPFNGILLSAAARTFPNELLSQVHEGGIIVLPVKNAIWKVTRFEHQPIIEKHDGFVFVPLITE